MLVDVHLEKGDDQHLCILKKANLLDLRIAQFLSRQMESVATFADHISGDII